MLDLIHYYFEDDMIPRWEQDSESKSKVRSVLYRSMYDREYKYASEPSDGRHADFDSDYPPEYDGPMELPVKPYFPPTDENDLQSILGAPMGE